MNFILDPPSLEHRTLVNIAVTLWCQWDIRDRISKLNPLEDGSWQGLEKEVTVKVSKLPLPAILKNKMLGIIGQVGIQIQSWMKFHKYHFRITELPSTLFWMPHGTIDCKKTAEVFAKDETLDVEDRFAWACFYCLEENIFDLWNKYIPLRNRMNRDVFAISFWCTYLEQTDDFHRTQTILDYFPSFAIQSEVTAIKYFCLKLSNHNIEQIILNTAKHVAEFSFREPIRTDLQRYSANLCFLLSTMNEKQQAKIFENCTYEVLSCLLAWPQHTLFLEAAKDKWTFLSMPNFHSLLYTIIKNINCKSYANFYLHELFREFWRQAPEAHKQFVGKSAHTLRTLFLVLFDCDDIKNIQLILDDVNILVKEMFIYGEWGRDMCKYLAASGKWDSVKYVIQECVPSPEEMITYTDSFRKYGT